MATQHGHHARVGHPVIVQVRYRHRSGAKGRGANKRYAPGYCTGSNLITRSWISSLSRGAAPVVGSR